MHPVILRAGPVIVYSYGLFVALGFLVTAFLSSREARRVGISSQLITDLLLVCLVSGIAGARALHVILNPFYYLDRPIEIFMLNRGGLAFQGGLIAALVAGLFYLKRQNLSYRRAGDILAQYIPLGQALGRIGCLLNGCCYGKFATGAVMFYLPGHLFPRHPTQIYYAVFHVFTFFLLRLIAMRMPRPGTCFFLYFIMDSIGRLGIDFFRGDLDRVFSGLTVSQYISAAILIAASAFLIRNSNEKRIA